jgi:transposase
MTAELFSAALGVEAPWSVTSVDFDPVRKRLTILIDFKPGTRFAVAGAEGAHPVHDTTTKSYRHLNFFQHD